MSLDQFPRWTRVYKGERGTLGAHFAVAVVFRPGLVKRRERRRLFISTDGGRIFQEMYLNGSYLTLTAPKEGETLKISFLVPRLTTGEIGHASLLVESHRAIVPFPLRSGVELVILPRDYVENLPQDYRVNTMGERRLELCDAHKEERLKKADC